jgi:hypothetical protein
MILLWPHVCVNVLDYMMLCYDIETNIPSLNYGTRQQHVSSNVSSSLRWWPSLRSATEGLRSNEEFLQLVLILGCRPLRLLQGSPTLSLIVVYNAPHAFVDEGRNVAVRHVRHDYLNLGNSFKCRLPGLHRSRIFVCFLLSCSSITASLRKGQWIGKDSTTMNISPLQFALSAQ